MNLMSVPGRLSPQRLIEMIGVDEAKRVMEAYHGRRIPRADGYVSREVRNRAIVDFYFECHSDLAATAAHFKLCKRHIARILNGR